jgi:hypothetical protein
LTEAQRIADRQRDQVLSRQAALQTRLQSVSDEAARGFERGTRQSRTLVDRLHRLNSESIAEMSAVFDLLERARGTWEARGQQILFTRQATLDAYNAHVATLQRLQRDEQALLVQMNAGQQRARDSITALEGGRDIPPPVNAAP